MSAYGYIRVSSRDQNEDRQTMAFQGLPIPEKNIFMDRQSGKDFNRPAYQRMLRRMRQDDLLYIKSIDRLGRNYEEILEQWRVLTKEKGIDIVVLDMPLLDTRRGKDLLGAFLSDIVLQVLSFVAENERENIRQRQAEGIAAAKERGVQFGRPPIPYPDNFIMVHREWRSKKIPLPQAAAACGMAVGTFYGKARKFEKAAETEEGGEFVNVYFCKVSVNLQNTAFSMSFRITYRHQPPQTLGKTSKILLFAKVHFSKTHGAQALSAWRQT